jgi:hypothetical protein
MKLGFAFIRTFSMSHRMANSAGVKDMDYDYRVVFVPFEEGSDEGEYSIREVYYNEDGEVTWYSDEAVELSGEDFWEFADEFDAIAEAFEQPVLVQVGDELVEDDSEDEDEE